MIPTVIGFGLVFGYWWRFCLAATMVAWPAMLAAQGVIGWEWGLTGAAGLAAANALPGILLHQGAARVIRLLRRRARADQFQPAPLAVVHRSSPATPSGVEGWLRPR